MTLKGLNAMVEMELTEELLDLLGTACFFNDSGLNKWLLVDSLLSKVNDKNLFCTSTWCLPICHISFWLT